MPVLGPPNPPSLGPSPTLSDLINEVRTHLYQDQVPQLNRLDGAINSSQTDLTFHYSLGVGAVARGQIIAIDLEHIRVWETQGNVISVCDRGIDGTAATTHTDGTVAEFMPKFSPFIIQRAINEDLDDLGSPANGLYSIQDIELTYNAAVSGYDLTDVNTGIPVTQEQVLAIQEIRYKIPGPSKHLPAIRHFDIARNVPTADYPSGMALLLYEGAFPGFPIHVRFRSRFQHLLNLTDDCQTVGLLPSAANGLPALGAAIQLMVGREVKRNFTEATSDPLQLELVTGGQVLNSYKGLQLQRQTRIQAVQAGLMRQYGMPLRIL